MRGGLYANIAALAAPALLTTGCVQATRHSNTMIFGTNTSFGIKVGTDTAQVPSVIVGYDRQEAVIMPLIANTHEHREGAVNRLAPCNLSAPLRSAEQIEYAAHPCSLVAIKDSAQDSYSVLASFGARFSGESGTAAKAEGGLAQYFATGMAAQILALTGAALVSTGDAARASAMAAPETAKAVPTLFGKQFGQGQAFKAGQGYANFEGKLRAQIAGAAKAGTLQAKIKTFEAAAGVSTGMGDACVDEKSCIDQLEDHGEYYELYDGATAAALDKAIANF